MAAECENERLTALNHALVDDSSEHEIGKLRAAIERKDKALREARPYVMNVLTTQHPRAEAYKRASRIAATIDAALGNVREEP